MSFSNTEPRLLPCWEAEVLISKTRVNGPGPLGVRNVVPITGGTFRGVLAPESADPRPFQGVVLPGGFDLQRERRDGVKELEAIYHMQTDDGVTIEIRNHAMVVKDETGQPTYRRSHIRVEAPEGPYAWLNTRFFLGTVESARPGEMVIIRSFVAV
ncbi:DUF3237 domain-containing protein [Maritimibacter alkaliphilus]|uniref:DUF3237 domain-containing protein n=1 Tax=Maritimibacter alkaliphilus TaxID=404236 RepID=UPI001C97BAF1|nr:DUF3237 domain-containing protein [Maritimibacter alkaliphilus]MBY6089523.1 DUF3237 domain-containing protein [Maritimibacter alkaliphilus]